MRPGGAKRKGGGATFLKGVLSHQGGTIKRGYTSIKWKDLIRFLKHILTPPI